MWEGRLCCGIVKLRNVLAVFQATNVFVHNGERIPTEYIATVVCSQDVSVQIVSSGVYNHLQPG